jgi:hypothetical protein
LGANTSSSVDASSFRYGFNAGYPNPAFDDQDLASLGVRAGATSERVSLPESHLDRWGYDIELADVQSYIAQGMGSLVGFLTSPIRSHSTAPATAADWELAYYIPSRLYEPTLGSDGAINPNNYWGNYVYKTVATYGKWIKVWEIWNEPDWVSDYQLTEQWRTRAPTSNDLPRFHGSIFDYVRMLRVSSEAARLAAPDARIATGGIGYATFLDAVLRYTDEPTAGAVDAEHPKTGRDYVDVISFHHYPIYTTGDSEAAVDSFLAQRSALGAVATASGKQFTWECTETGAPHVSVGSFPGGVEYARNYLLKVMALAPSVGLSGVHWFVLSDAGDSGASDDPYDFMGLYHPVGSLGSVSEAQPTDTGVAYRTLTSLIAGCPFDAAATSALQAALGNQARIVAYRSGDARQRAVIWAVAPTGAEAARAVVTLPSERDWLQFEANASITQSSLRINPTDGRISVSITSTPSILVEQ